jgi:hypothetical protein
MNFLQSHVGKNCSLILIASKKDLLYKTLGFFNKEDEMNKKLIEINMTIKKLIEENNIELNFHLFEKDFYFQPVNNFDFDIKNSGISSIHQILCSQYDKIENSIRTSMMHKFVLELIEKIGKENPIISFSEIEKQLSNTLDKRHRYLSFFF